MQLFPAVVIGGPPNSGKSVLTFHLSQRLREGGVQHYVLRAAPDGEGDWTGQAKPDLVRTILVPEKWTPAWVEHICQGLANRHLPLIVDVGGRPADWQEAIFDHCTHAVLLTPQESAHAFWVDLINRHNLLLLADLRSVLQGVNEVTSRQPVLAGVISGLEWGKPVGGPTFDRLLERLARLFAYDAGELRRAHLTAAPVETVIDLLRLARALGVSLSGDKPTWEPHHLPRLLDYLPGARPLGLYGRGPNWLYAALAGHTYPASLYQFDVRLGWVAPPALTIGPTSSASPVAAQVLDRETHTRLEASLTGGYLDYAQAAGLVVPRLPPGRGVVLSGKLPLWLWTALVQVYHDAPWLAVFQPPLGDQAVVVASRDKQKRLGSLVASRPSPRPERPG